MCVNLELIIDKLLIYLVKCLVGQKIRSNFNEQRVLKALNVNLFGELLVKTPVKMPAVTMY
jgi:hypothetical protein